MLRVVFLGTPDFALPSFEALLKHPEVEVVAAVTQPDRPKGRGKAVQFSPVKERALLAGVPVLQYRKIRLEGVEDLKALNPDLMVTAAFGQILSQEILDIPKYGILNVHGSLLPKYRGAAPVQWAVINGEKESGITIMKTEIGIDTGDMLLKKVVPIGEEETAGELFDRLAELGGEAITEAIDRILDKSAEFTPQNEAEATHCSMLKKEDGLVDFSLDAASFHNFVRGMNPWPGAFFRFGEEIVKLHSVRISELATDAPCGTVVCSDAKKGLFVAVNGGVVSFEVLQFPNGKRLKATDVLNGRSIPVGTKFEGR